MTRRKSHDADTGTVTPRRRSSDRMDVNQVLAGGGEMGALMRSMDWATTALGPVESWPQSLLTAVGLCLASRFPIVIYWGLELVTIYNDAYAPILGSKHPWAVGRPCREVWAEIWDVIGPMLAEVMTSRKATWSEDTLLVLERGGYPEECYFSFSFTPVHAEYGRVGGVFTAVIETTERVIGARRLLTLRELAQHVIAGTTVEQVCERAARTLAENPADLPFSLIYLVDADKGRLNLIAASGLAATASVRLNAIPLNGADDGWAACLSQVVAGGRAEHVNLEGAFTDLLDIDSVNVPTAAMVLPIARAGQANPFGILIAGISPRRALDDHYRGFYDLLADGVTTAIANARAYEEERSRSEALAEIDRAKTTFFSNVSHEFRTPLTLMLGPTEDLLSGVHGPLASDQRRQVELLRRNQLRLQRLVNALLEFSRIEAGRMNASYAPVDLGALTCDLASSFRAAIERAGLTFDVDCGPLDEPVFVDRDMWEQVVLNLLSNAFKFTFEGQIAVSLRPDNDHVVLRVEDTGVGVRPEEVPRLFERFHRVEGTRARTHEGSGIGLALVQELVRLHGGTIRVESRYGSGTSFTVTLPKGSAHLPPERISATGSSTVQDPDTASFVEEAVRWLPSNPSVDQGGPKPATSANRRILVVDDNADMRDYLRRILETQWHVEAAADGEAALTAVSARQPDLILTDVMMPGLDGFGLLQRLRADPVTEAIPVIMLSARAGEEARVEGFQAGAEDYLIKPFSARELLARVRTHLELARLRNQVRAQREYLYSLFMQAPVPICVFRGEDLIFEMANPLYEEVAGHHNLIGKPFCQGIPEARGQGFDDLLRDVMMTRRPYVGTEALVRLDRDGDGVPEDIYFTFIYAPVFNETGVADRVIAVVNDVTDQVLGRRTGQQAQAELTKTIALREEFLTVASHELRTPLTTLGFYAESLVRALRQLPDDDPAVERCREKVEKLRLQANRLEQLTENMIDLSSVSRGALELHREALDLADVLRSVVDRLAKASRQANAAITLHAESLNGRWDRLRLEQMLQHLVSNAVKFGAGRPVDVVVDGSDQSVRILVTDQGIGIAAADQERVFERFVRAAPSDQYAGFGIGLWIVRELAHAMGGSVGVQSQPGAGATFIVELPRHP